LIDFFFKLKPQVELKVSTEAWQQKRHHHHPMLGMARLTTEPQENSGSMTACCERTRTSHKKRSRIIARKQKYNDNSPTSVEGRIIFLILLALKQLNHSTI
jgi:hypothetical protein